jgi:Flp pilus assembly pilin Flp
LIAVTIIAAVAAIGTSVRDMLFARIIAAVP